VRRHMRTLQSREAVKTVSGEGKVAARTYRSVSFSRCREKSPNNSYIGFVPDQLRRQLEVGHFPGGWFDGWMMRVRDTAECSGGGELDE
jgi:hypothetical protein